MSISCLYLMPTLRCNSRCTYCYIPKQFPEADDKSESLFRGLAQFIRETKPGSTPFSPQIRFIGGEPYLARETMQSLGQQFLESFPGQLVVVNSNATLLSREDVHFWRGLPGWVVHIVSLDGPAHVHDRRRVLAGGQGTFKKVISGIRLLKTAGLEVWCNMVLDRESGNSIDSFFRFIRDELGMRELSVSLVSRAAYWKNPEEQWTLLETAYEAAARFELTLTGHHRLYAGLSIPGLRCRAGEKTLLLAPDGRLYACQRFVGKTSGIPYTSTMSLATHRAGLETSAVCVDESFVSLGEKLCSLYRDRFPSYLTVSRLDRIFFGVIQEEDP